MNILDVILGREEKTGEKEWDAIEKSLINAESIEKSRKGKRRANHKYIRVFTKADGKDEYLYKKDMLSPFKSLLRFFGIGEEKIAKTYEKENIERSYGVDKKTFGMHVLEYLTNRKKWDGLFSKKDERKKYKKPVAQEVIEKKAAERKAKLNGTTEAPAEQADKNKDNKDKIPTINRSLMRKVYSLYNPIPEDKTEPEIKTDVKPASEKINEFVGRKMTKKPDGTTVMTWEDGRIIHTDRKGNIIYDNAETSQPKAEKDLSPAENATVAPTESAVEDTSKPEQKVKYAKLTKDGASLSIYKDGRIFLNNFMTAGGNMIWIQKDPHYKPEYEKGYTSDWDTKTYGIIPFSSNNMYEELEKLIPDIQRMTYDEIVAYIRNDTKSLSEAMQGNQNARKPFTVDDFTVDTKNLIAETKANDDYISRMLSLQNSYKGYTDQMLANEIKLKSIGSTLTDKERRLGAKVALEMLIAEMRARNAEKKEQSPAETTETATEEHQDRSEAMMGNDNAKKDVSSDTVIMNPRTYDNEEDQKKYNDALKYHIDFVNHSNTDKGYLEDTIKGYESYPDFENKPEIDALKDIYKEYIGEDYDETHKDLSEAMEGNQNAAGEHDVEPQTEKEMKEEQKKTEEAREKAGLKKPGKNYGERVSAMEDAYFSYNPNAENYAYKDTGYIAGSQKEKIAQFWADVQERGGGVKIEDIDWEALEENLRYAESKIIKANILKKPDFEALRENGMTGGAAYFYNRLIDCIPTKPAKNTPEMHKQYVLAINTFQERMEKCKTVDEMTKEMSEIGDEMAGNYVGADKLPEAIALQRQIDEATEKSRAENKELSNAENKLWEIPEIKQWVKDNNSEIKRYYGKPYPFGFTDRRFETEDNKLMENFLFYWQKNSKYYDFIKENEEKLSKYESFKEYKKLLDEYEIKSNKKYTRDITLISPSYKKAMELEKQKKDFIQNKNDEYKNSAEYKMWAAFGPQASGTKIKNRFYEYMESADGFHSFIYYGNKTILNHYRNAKRGKFDDWEWLPKKEENSVSGEKKEQKESFQLLVATEHDRKGGKDVSVKTTQELKDMFKLRDIQSGEWVLSDPRSAKWHVDRCCEGFSDLCDVTGIPENLISLNGRLALAIGARGHKGALAHYEPVERVINITKMHGGGSLAHEWFHSFDNMLSEAMLGGNIDAWLTKPGKNHYRDAPDNVIPEIKQAFANLVDAMKKGDNPVMKPVKVTDTDRKNPDKVLESVLYYRNYSANVMDVFSSVKKAETYEEANRILMDNFKALTSYNGRVNSTKVRDFQKAQKAIAAKFGKTDVDVFTGETASDFFIESRKLDHGKDGYWSSLHEMAARAFSGFIGDNLRNAGRLNTYLTSHDTNDSYVLYGVKPNPEGEERERINKAFKELFDAVKSTGAIQKAIDWLDVESVAKSTARLPKIAIKLGKDGNPVFLFRKSAWTE